MRSRLALQQTSWFAVLLLALAWAGYGITSRSMQREFDDRVSDRSAIIHSLMVERNGSKSLLDPLTNLTGSEALMGAYYQVLDAKGKVLTASGSPQLSGIPVTSAAMSALTSRKTTWESIEIPGGVSARVVNRVISDGANGNTFLLRVAMSTEEMEERLHHSPAWLLMVIPLIIAIHALTAWRMSGEAVSPMVMLTSAVRDLSAVDPKRRLASPDSSREVSALTDAINKLMDRLEASSENLKEFLPNVSHEIRQPLANLRAESEFGLRHARTVEEYREVLTHQVSSVDMITSTISDLMQLARCGSLPIKTRKQEQSVSELVQATVDSMIPVANLAKVQLTSNILDGIEGEIDTAQFCRVLQNLIDNAIKYNHEEGHVHVLVNQRNTSTTILISDTGAGISAEELPLIFERSYRSQKARASRVQGSGLGLYFAKMVVEAHQGQISAESVEGQGTSFRITLPGTRLVPAVRVGNMGVGQQVN